MKHSKSVQIFIMFDKVGHLPGSWGQLHW